MLATYLFWWYFSHWHERQHLAVTVECNGSLASEPVGSVTQLLNASIGAEVLPC